MRFNPSTNVQPPKFINSPTRILLAFRYEITWA